MPAFDIHKAKSEEVAVARELRDRLSECKAFRELALKDTAEDARANIFIGPTRPMADGHTFSIEELDTQHAWASIIPPEDEGGDFFEDEGAEERSFLTQIPLIIDLRFRPSDAEVNTHGAQNQFNFFWDVCGQLPQQIRDAVKANDRQCPRVRRVTRLGTVWGTLQEEQTRGFQIYTEFLVIVGDLGE